MAAPLPAEHVPAAVAAPVVTDLASRAGLRSRGEGTLVRAALRGEEPALAELFRRHWPRCYRTAYLIVHDAAAAEDIAQESFLAALRNLDGFDRRRRLGPWLARIVANRSIDHLRARQARREAAGAPPEPAGEQGGPRGLSEELVAALRTLAPEQRAVVVLRYVLELTPGEIATALELPRGTVNSRLRRGLDALERALDGSAR